MLKSMRLDRHAVKAGDTPGYDPLFKRRLALKFGMENRGWHLGPLYQAHTRDQKRHGLVKSFETSLMPPEREQ